MKNTIKMTIIALAALVMTFVFAVPAQAATEVPLSKVSMLGSVSLMTGDSKTISISTAPANTTSKIQVTWTVTANGAFTVTKNATSIVVKATAAGSGTITASIKELNSAGRHIKTYTAKTTVTVTKKVALSSISLNKTSATLNKGNTLNLTVAYNPTNTTDSKTVTWTSSNTSVLHVSSAGKVTALAAGTATITAKVGSKTATCKITVKNPITKLSLSQTSATLEVGKKLGLTVSYAPANTTDSKTVTWTSSNTAVATVSNGTITAKAAGTATITAKMGSKTATCTVTVKAVAPKFVNVDACYSTLTTYRKNAKLSALKKDATLEGIAQTRAKELVKKYSHTRPDGTSGLSLIKGNVYKGENIAMGQKTCADVMTAWYNSAGHKANMLSKNYTKVGVAGYQVGGVIYWVMVFSS